VTKMALFVRVIFRWIIGLPETGPASFDLLRVSIFDSRPEMTFQSGSPCNNNCLALIATKSCKNNVCSFLSVIMGPYI